MDINAMTSYLQTQYDTSTASSAASTASNSVNSISQTSTKEEIEKAVKDFEGYFVEQILKQVKDSIESVNDDEDSTISMYSDYFMDSTISDLASKLVDDLGSGLTDDFVKQIMLNYGISDTTSSSAEDSSTTSEAMNVEEV